LIVFFLIVPHAGYVYSGQVAAYGFKQVRDAKNIFILAANHNPYAIYNGASVPDFEFYKTPLGDVKVSNIVKKLLKRKMFLSLLEAHMSHVVEVELPFLQKRLNNFEIIPIITSLHPDETKPIAKELEKYVDDKALIIVSADQSHYHSYEEAKRIDKQNIECILDFNLGFPECEIDGEDAVSILLHLAKKFKWKPKLLEYKNSGDVTGDTSSVVGYASIGFYQR